MVNHHLYLHRRGLSCRSTSDSAKQASLLSHILPVCIAQHNKIELQDTSIKCSAYLKMKYNDSFKISLVSMLAARHPMLE